MGFQAIMLKILVALTVGVLYVLGTYIYLGAVEDYDNLVAGMYLILNYLLSIGLLVIIGTIISIFVELYWEKHQYRFNVVYDLVHMLLLSVVMAFPYINQFFFIAGLICGFLFGVMDQWFHHIGQSKAATLNGKSNGKYPLLTVAWSPFHEHAFQGSR